MQNILKILRYMYVSNVSKKVIDSARFVKIATNKKQKQKNHMLKSFTHKFIDFIKFNVYFMKIC